MAQPLPMELKHLFWEYADTDLDLKVHFELIVRKVLSYGSWDEIQLLRKLVGDRELSSWLIKSDGASLNPMQLTFYQLLWGIDSTKVERWIERSKTIWGRIYDEIL